MLAMLTFGYQLAVYVQNRDEHAFKAQAEMNAVLREQNASLQTRVAELEAELVLEQLQIETLEQQYAELMQEKQSVEQDLSFYQRVMAPENTQDGFLIDGIEITPAASTDYYRLRFVMLQQQDNKALIKGSLAISISGSLNGKPYEIRQGSEYLLVDGALKYRFKYFWPVDTNIKLPDGFKPELVRFETTVYQYTTRRGDYSREVRWDDVLTSPSSES